MALMITKEINEAYELEREFAEYDRDYYSEDGYEFMLDYYDDMELDVIAMCSECTEYDVDEFVDYYEYEETFVDYLIDNGIADDYCVKEEIDIEDFSDDDAEFFKDEHYDDYINDLIDTISRKTHIERLDNDNIMVVE